MSAEGGVGCIPLRSSRPIQYSILRFDACMWWSNQFFADADPLTSRGDYVQGGLRIGHKVRHLKVLPPL